MARIINYAGSELEDVFPGKPVKDVLKWYSQNGMPALANASVVGPTKRGEDEVYEAKISTGTKG